MEVSSHLTSYVILSHHTHESRACVAIEPETVVKQGVLSTATCSWFICVMPRVPRNVAYPGRHSHWDTAIRLMANRSSDLEDICEIA